MVNPTNIGIFTPEKTFSGQQCFEIYDFDISPWFAFLKYYFLGIWNLALRLCLR